MIRKLINNPLLVLRALRISAFVFFSMNTYDVVSGWWQRASWTHEIFAIFGVLFMGYLAFVRYPRNIAAEKRRVAEKKIWEATVGGWDQEADHD